VKDVRQVGMDDSECMHVQLLLNCIPPAHSPCEWTPHICPAVHYKLKRTRYLTCSWKFHCSCQARQPANSHPSCRPVCAGSCNEIITCCKQTAKRIQDELLCIPTAVTCGTWSQFNSGSLHHHQHSQSPTSRCLKLYSSLQYSMVVIPVLSYPYLEAKAATRATAA
jgi:hypothetical protein